MSRLIGLCAVLSLAAFVCAQQPQQKEVAFRASEVQGVGRYDVDPPLTWCTIYLKRGSFVVDAPFKQVREDWVNALAHDIKNPQDRKLLKYKIYNNNVDPFAEAKK